jgi:biopolymer transport protein ExbB
VTIKKLCFVLLFALVPLSAIAGTWWNGDWKYRKEIDFDLTATGADIAGSAQNVPVLVRLSLANFNYFNDVKADGSDFRAIAGDDKTPLKFHIERFDPQNQFAYIWVDMPALTAGAKTDKFYLYYGNSSAAAADDAPGTFDVNQALVMEFSETSGLPKDATAYKNNATASTAELTPTSLIAGGVKFSGTQSIAVPASASLRVLPSQGLTASAWVKFAGAQKQADVISLSDQGRELVLGIDGVRAFARYNGGTTPVLVAQSQGDLSGADWHLLTLSISQSVLTLYVDGAVAGQANVTLQEIGGVLTVGASGANSNFYSGELDELSVAKAVRAPEWIKAVAHAQGSTESLVVYGADGQKEGGGQGSYFVTIARNLTVDGWVVIVICMSMLLMAIAIMVLKALYLGRVEKANVAFLRDYHKLASDSDATALDQSAGDQDTPVEDSTTIAMLVGHEGKYAASTLYSLYHMGVTELQKRVPGRAAGAQSIRTLTPQAIEAIRAAMDATLTRLQLRLSSQMVLLTIAISGGPFLGLLGTVIGVMITFAAIALSGDVNVNAIAPGTAAALAATVAGLSVAIPSLFGYNWLNTRIKSTTANNRVFLDEFVARLAEQYS